MSFLVPIMMFGWIPLAVALFALLPPRRAVITGILFAWLFLPVASFPLPGLPDYSKINAVSIGLLLGMTVFDFGRLLAFRPRLIDLPMIVFCLCPMASSLDNGLGIYDGLSAVLEHLFAWGIPYLLGRIYFTTLEDLRELAIGVFLGGLIYMPLCLFEIRMSPQLHRWLYGYLQRPWGLIMRYEGYRPLVFLQGGLAVCFWMAGTTVVGLWLWAGKSLQRLCGLPVGFLVCLMAITTVLSKSSGSLSLLLLGAALLVLVKYANGRWALLGLVTFIPLFITLRIAGQISSDRVSGIASQLVDQERLASLRCRLDNEDALAAKALQRPIFGWSGWGRARIKDDAGQDISVTDGLWIIIFGNNGMVGLVALLLWLLLPAYLWARHLPDRSWLHPSVAPAMALSVLVVLHVIDSIPNGFPNPVLYLVAGATTTAVPTLLGLVVQPRRPVIPRLVPKGAL